VSPWRSLESPEWFQWNSQLEKVAFVLLAKAGTTDKNKVIKAREGLELDLPVGKVQIRAGDHQAIIDGVWGVTSEFDGKLRCRVLKPMRVFPGQEITPSLEATGCNMRN
jgi:branched-chain amino acid transport system substrate-binding protein